MKITKMYEHYENIWESRKFIKVYKIFEIQQIYNNIWKCKIFSKFIKIYQNLSKFTKPT